MLSGNMLEICNFQVPCMEQECDISVLGNMTFSVPEMDLYAIEYCQEMYWKYGSFRYLARNWNVMFQCLGM